MTRYARCGSTQKHKKLPGDATPWEEFSRNANRNSDSYTGPTGNKKIRMGCIEKKKHQLKKAFPSKKLAKWSGSNDSGIQAFKKHLAEEKKTKEVKTNINNDFNSIKSINDLTELNVPRNSDSMKISLESIVERNNELNIPLLTKSIESSDVFVEKKLSKRQSKKFRKQNKSQDFKMKDEKSCYQNEGESIVNALDSSLFAIGDEIVNAPQAKQFSKRQLKKAKRKEKLQGMKTENELPRKEILRNGNFLKMSMGNMQGNNELNISLQTQSNECCDVQEANELSKRQLKKLKKQNKSQNFQIQEGKSSDNQDKEESIINDPVCSLLSKDNKVMTAPQAKQLSNSPLKTFQNMKTERAPLKNIQEGNDSEEKEKIDDKSPKDKGVKVKKKLYFERLQKRRLENGIVLLPSKVERKIYNIKKALRNKGLPSEFIKNVIRKERRKEEKQFRQTFSTKSCFNCREKGHLLAECPLRGGSTYLETGICFKCGSTEHVSYKCHKKVEGYPLAKCFICKEQGHISKDCPKNEHGIYVQGGKCNACGNVNHVQKDCPKMFKKSKKEEYVIPTYTIKKGASIDAETIDNATETKKKIPKPQKVVIF